jgi:CRP/FNR family transcriptional regulator, cyclic AMP receptor protein
LELGLILVKIIKYTLLAIEYKELIEIRYFISMETVIDQILFLQKVPIFKDLTVEQLGHIAAVSSIEDYEAGEYLFREGDIGYNSYVVISGKVELLRNVDNKEKVRIAMMESGSYFGEMAVFDGDTRSASAKTLESSIIMSYTKDSLDNVIMKYPSIGLRVIKVLSQRVRENVDKLHKFEKLFAEFKKFSQHIDEIMEVDKNK